MLPALFIPEALAAFAAAQGVLALHVLIQVGHLLPTSKKWLPKVIFQENSLTKCHAELEDHQFHPVSNRHLKQKPLVFRFQAVRAKLRSTQGPFQLLAQASRSSV